MFKRDKAIMLALCLPLAVWAGVTASTEAPGPVIRPSSKASAPAPKPAGAYQVRCWQYGRLLFEENRVSLPPGDGYAVKITGTDAQGHPLYVAETTNATCLIRRTPPQSPLTPPVRPGAGR